jgi:hypothetical protein
MIVRTYIDEARTRVDTERDAFVAKLAAFDTFVTRVSDLSTESTPATPPSVTATAGTRARDDASADERCRGVRKAFDETIRPHSIADVEGSEPLLETIRKEFTDSIAIALAPATAPSFSPELRRTIVAEADARRAELEVACRALEKEARRLENARELVDEAAAWIADADETPLTDLGFEALRDRHETLAGHRDRCEELAHRRQAFLEATTNQGTDAGIRHRTLFSYLYRELPNDYPVLATVASLDRVCNRCQRAVRSHLVRRA